MIAFKDWDLIKFQECVILMSLTYVLSLK